MGKNIDYSWMIALGAVILIVVFWKPIMHGIGSAHDTMTNKEGIERGKAVFYDTARWEPGSYKSCAMCHADDFVPDKDKKIEMADYVEGKPFSLKNAKNHARDNNLGTDDGLVAAINKCISHPNRIRTGTYSVNVPFMQDLLVYVKSL